MAKFKAPNGDIFEVPDGISNEDMNAFIEAHSAQFQQPKKTSSKQQSIANIENAKLKQFIDKNNQKVANYETMQENFPVISRTIQAMFPRMYESAMGGETHGMKQFANVAQDVLSMPGRAYMGIGGGTMGEIEQPGEGVGAALGNIVRSPATGAGAMVPSTLIPKGIGFIGKAGQMAAQGAMQGAAMGASNQAENYGQTGQIDPEQFGEDVLTNALLNPVVGGVGAGIIKGSELGRKGVQFGTKLASKAAQHSAFVGKPENIKKALTALNENPEAIFKAAGKEKEIGEAVQKAVYDLQAGKTENKIINKAISKTPDIDLESTYKTIKNEIIPSGKTKLEPFEQKVNSELKALLDRLRNPKESKLLDARGNPMPSYSNEKISAKEFLSKRRAIDQTIDWGKLSEQEANLLDAKLENVRRNMADELEKAAPSEYAPAIKMYAKKLKNAENLLKSVGGREIKNNPEMFITRLGDVNKNLTREHLKTLDELLNTDLSEQAKKTIYAKWLGINAGDANLPIMPQHKTGLGKINPMTVIGNPRGAAYMNKLENQPISIGLRKSIKYANKFINNKSIGIPLSELIRKQNQENK